MRFKLVAQCDTCVTSIVVAGADRAGDCVAGAQAKLAALGWAVGYTRLRCPKCAAPTLPVAKSSFCRECGAETTYVPGTVSKKRTFCGGACKAKDYRRRKSI